MPPIEGNFKETLKILPGGKEVEAIGPLTWPDKAHNMTLHVAIMKDKVAATGRGDLTRSDLTKTKKTFVVEAQVQGEGKLTPGPAIATGLALVPGEGLEMYQWSEGIDLVNGTA